MKGFQDSRATGRCAGENGAAFPQLLRVMPVLLGTDWLPGPWSVNSSLA